MTGSITPETRLSHAPGLVVEFVDREIVTWEPVAEQLHRLDEPAALIFQLLAPEESLETIVEAIAEAVGEDAATVRGDVLTLSEQLLERGLVRLL